MARPAGRREGRGPALPARPASPALPHACARGPRPLGPRARHGQSRAGWGRAGPRSALGATLGLGQQQGAGARRPGGQPHLAAVPETRWPRKELCIGTACIVLSGARNVGQVCVRGLGCACGWSLDCYVAGQARLPPSFGSNPNNSSGGAVTRAGPLLWQPPAAKQPAQGAAARHGWPRAAGAGPAAAACVASRVRPALAAWASMAPPAPGARPPCPARSRRRSVPWSSWLLCAALSAAGRAVSCCISPGCGMPWAGTWAVVPAAGCLRACAGCCSRGRFLPSAAPAAACCGAPCAAAAVQARDAGCAAAMVRTGNTCWADCIGSSCGWLGCCSRTSRRLPLGSCTARLPG